MIMALDPRSYVPYYCCYPKSAIPFSVIKPCNIVSDLPKTVDDLQVTIILEYN